MFFSEETSKKHSLFGSFENQLKHNAINQTNSNFEVIPFMELCNQETHWYNDLMNHIFERENKLQPNFRPKKSIHLDLGPSAKSTSNKVHISSSQVESKKTNQYTLKIQQSKETIQYDPKSPQPKETIQYDPKSPDFVEPQEPTRDIVMKDSPSPMSKIPQMPSEKTQPLSSQRELVKYDNLATTTPSKKQPHGNKNQQKGNNRNQKHVPYPWSQNTRAVNIMKSWYPLKFKLAYPKKSVLNSREQKDFLELHSRFRNRTHLNEKEVKSYKTYSHLKNIIIKERVQFLEFSKKYYENAGEDYEFMNASVSQYIKELINCHERIPLSFDRYYSKVEEFTLKELDTHQKANFELKEKLVSLGNIPKVIVPSISQNSQPVLNVNYQQLSKRAPVSQDTQKRSKTPLSNDENAEKLALKYNANVVMTNSSFVNLIYYLSGDNQEDLQLPVSIKVLKDPSGSERKIVFIDKPFISKNLSKREQNEKFFKRSLMISFAKSSMNTRNRASFKHQQKPSEDSLNNSQVYQTEHQSVRIGSQIVTLDVDHTAISQYESFGVEVKDTVQKKRTIEEAPLETNKKLKSDIESTSDLISKITDFKEELTQKKVVEQKSSESEPKFSHIDSSDYEDYNDEDALVIDTNNNSDPKKSEKTIEIDEGPSSPSDDMQLKNLMELNVPKDTLALKNEVVKFIQSTNIDSASESENLPDFKPKVIPLSRSGEAINSMPKTSSSDNVSQNTDQIKPCEKLTLSDLLSKMKEKRVINSNTPSNITNSAQHMLSSLTPISAKPLYAAESAKDYLYIDNMHDNLSYHLWEFNTFRVLIRLSVDGYVNTENSSLNSIVLYPKLEYQPQFGGEKLSHKDYCKMWAKSFIRNNCDVMLCRINVFTNKLISATSLNHKDILKGCTDFNSQFSLNLMKSLLEKFNSLPAEKYLLSKTSNDNKFTIYKYSESKGIFDLHSYYQRMIGQVKDSNWLPVDADIYLPYHHQLSRVPCLFEPAGNLKNSPQSKRNNKKRGGKDKKNSSQNNKQTLSTIP